VFLEQLGDALRRARSNASIDHAQINRSAARHGRDLWRMGLTIAQVVHDYGDVCQVVTELVVEQKATIGADEFRTLNLCLDDAIAQAVSEYAHDRESSIAHQSTERLGVLAHELRNQLNAALLSFEIIKSGRVASGGSTALVHARSLVALRDLVDRSLANVRIEDGIERLESLVVADLIEEVEVGAMMQAQSQGLEFVVTSVARPVLVRGDRPLLVAAVSNLLQNAFKFTKKHSRVTLTARVTKERVLVDVEDECGGLPPGEAEMFFRPFSQRDRNRTGLGLGLTICRRAAQASGGDVRVRDIPGKGCVFTLDLPLAPPPHRRAGGGEGPRHTARSSGRWLPLCTCESHAPRVPP
jgi:signal transduction histidine kinase